MSKIKTLIVPVGWHTEGTFVPEFIKFEFSLEEIEKIKNSIKVAKENNLEYVVVRADGEFFDDKECTKEHTEFKADVMHFRIFPHGSIYLYAQNKYDSSSQLESEEFTVEEIETEEFINE